MPFSWHRIHQSLVRSASTHTFNRTFLEMRGAHPALARFTDVTALLDHLHHGSASSDEKNDILAALITVARCRSAASDAAVTVLLLALWPGLDAVFHRLSRRVEAPEEMPSEVLDHAVEQIRRLDLQSVRRMAATILMNVERDVARAGVRERNRRRLAVELDPELIADEGSAFSTTPDLLVRDVIRHAGSDGRLVVRVAIEGFSQVEIAAEIGISESAARKRYQRVSRHLQTVFSDGMSRSVPPSGLSPSSAHAQTEKEGTGHMTCIDEAEDLTRMPGLYRRWEFPEALQTRRTYRLEEGGAHADGTPLISIYTDILEPDDTERSGVHARDAKTGDA
jgi:DNA-directed RNA polymerase specialized sigma24 family protein